MDITPSSEKLQVLYEEDYRICVLYGGRGSGKSIGIAEFLVLMAVSKPNTNILCCRDLTKSIGPSSFAALTRTMKRLGLYHLFTETRDRITCVNGSEFTFAGLRTNVEDNLKSIDGINYVWVEEAATIKEESWRTLEPSIREAGSKILVSFNPRYASDFISDLFISGKELPPRTKVVKINYYDNRYFFETELVDGMEYMKRTDLAMYLHIYEGEFLNIGDNKIFANNIVQEAANRISVVNEDIPVVAAVDIARFGGDSSVMCIREDNLVHPLKKWKDKEVDEMVNIIAGEVISNKIDILIIDAAGLGAGHFVYLKKTIGNICKVIEYNSAFGAVDKKKYGNARAETHFGAKEALPKLKLPNDLELHKQLINIEYTYNNKNQLMVESKQAYKDRNAGNSPDEMDAFTMTFYKNFINRRKELNLNLLNQRGRR